MKRFGCVNGGGVWFMVALTELTCLAIVGLSACEKLLFFQLFKGGLEPNNLSHFFSVDFK